MYFRVPNSRDSNNRAAQLEFRSRGLMSFLTNGRFEQQNIPLNMAIPQIIAVAGRTNNFEEIKTEIDTDLNEFFNYLRNSIYYACGIEDFFEQELDNLRSRFLDMELISHTWQTAVIQGILNGRITTNNEVIDQRINLDYNNFTEAREVLRNLQRYIDNL